MPGPMSSPETISPLPGSLPNLVLDEDQALALLKSPDLPPDVLEQLSKNPALLKSRKIKLGIVAHQKTPRYVSLALIRQLFTFDLMRVALMPTGLPDIKRAAEEVLINRIETIALGAKVSLARRASGRVAGQLLLDSEPRVFSAALQNPRLTEVAIVRVLMREDTTVSFVQAVCRDPKWSLRREIRIALLLNEKTQMARALEFARSLPARVVKETMQRSRLPANIKSYLLKDLASRS